MNDSSSPPPTERGAARIAVLPFDNPSGDPEQGYFARGFVEDLATELGRFPALEVVHPRDAEAARRVAGTVEFELHGSVRRLGEIVRIAVQLVDAGSRRQVFAERFDAQAEALFDTQDEIVERVTSALALRIDRTRLDRARRQPLASLEVYDCWLRGLDCLRRGTADDDERARAFFERALVLDPLSARAHAGLSLSHFNEWSCQTWELWDEKERLAFEHARRAADLDDHDAVAQLVLARILLYRRRFDEAQRHLERAVALAPSDPDVLAHGGLCRAMLGDADGGLALVEKAGRLNPRRPPWYAYCAAVSLFLLDRHADSLARAAEAPTLVVDMPAYAAASHASLGNAASARAELDRFLAELVSKITFGRVPDAGEPLRWLLHVNPFRRPQDALRFADALRAAGLGDDPDSGRAAAPADPLAGEPDRARFRRDGQTWSIRFEGRALRLTEAKGFHDLAALIACADREIHCLELCGRPADAAPADAAIDRRGRLELTARARELQAEIDELDELHDAGRAERAREELDRIVTVLAGALGLGGRERRIGSAAERARAAVTWRIRSAIRKIGDADAALGRHLENSVRTGTYCRYAPEKRIDWDL